MLCGNELWAISTFRKFWYSDLKPTEFTSSSKVELISMPFGV